MSENVKQNNFTQEDFQFVQINEKIFDKKFETKAVWWAQIIKALVGIGLVLAAKELLKFPLNAILDENTWARLVRYFLMVIVGGVLWPMTFKYFARLGNNKEEN